MENKKKFKPIIAVAVLAVVVSVLIIWKYNSVQFHMSGFCMDTYFDISFYGPKKADVREEVSAKLSELNRLFDVNNQGGDVYRINEAAGEFVEVSEDTAYVISRAKAIGEITGRALDITVFPVVKAWGFTTDENRVPGPEEIAGLLNFVDVSKIEIEGNKVKIPKGYMIDLGSVAKGYAGECIKSIFEEHGIKHALIDLGGNIVCIGTKPGGGNWNIGVASPYEDRSIPGTVSVSNRAVVTSGAYERFFEENGVRYGHIMDPETGYPADSGLMAVTIIADDGLLADALSTAVFVGGEELAVTLKESSLDFEYILFLGNGEIRSSESAEFSYIVK